MNLNVVSYLIIIYHLLNDSNRIERQVRSLLNEIAPDNLVQVVEKLADIRVNNRSELVSMS